MKDRADFEALALPHLDALWSLARRLCSDPRDAEDLVQDTFVSAFAAFASWRGGDMRAWLVVICLNTHRSTGRRWAARPTEILDMALLERAARDDPCDEAAARLDRASVHRALGRLPSEQRIAIELVDIAGLTAQAAADTLGCPRATVLARVHRGRRKLAELLEAEGVRDDV